MPGGRVKGRGREVKGEDGGWEGGRGRVVRRGIERHRWLVWCCAGMYEIRAARNYDLPPSPLSGLTVGK